MKTLSSLPYAVALVGITAALAQSGSVPAIPHFEKRGSATQMIVDGRPFLMLGGELTNSASSSLEYLAPYWPKLAAANMNTILAAVSWELIEPEQGAFDFSLVDGMIRDARRHHLRLIFLWFGSWKNGVSTYVPLWVKRDSKRFPLFQAENGQNLAVLSVFHEANWKADATAYAALMRHIREVDGDAHTVIMMQVENEVGCPGGTRDHLPAATAAFDGAVPRQLLDYMAKNREGMVPEFRKQWETAGGKTSGTWQEVFGKEPMTNEIFMAWNYALYVDRVTKAGKAEYNLPMYINVDLGEKIGQYSSGGALPIVLNVWQQGAPNIDVIAPDIYLPNFADWCALYNRSGNPLWIPETRADAANAFYAIGKHAAMGITPFGIERSADASTPYAKAYDVLAQAAPAILEAQAKGAIAAVMLNAAAPAQSVKMGNYTLDFTMGRGRRPPAPTPGAGAATPGPGAAAAAESYALVIGVGPDDYIILGNGVQATFSGSVPSPSAAGIGLLEEGVYVDGRWVPGRRLNGDDIMMNYDSTNQAVKNQSGQGFRLAGDGPRILHLKLYRF
jgi:hypothetical protein